jgi:hypothetical protein
MRTASDPLRASRTRIAELRNLGNVDLDRLGRLVDPVVDRFLHARDVDAVIALDPARRTELAQEIWRPAKPPYMVSVGGEGGEEPFVFYVAGDHYSEALRHNAIPPDAARAAMRHFLMTGELSPEVQWEEV